MKTTISICIIFACINGLLAWDWQSLTNKELLADDSRQFIELYEKEFADYLETGVQSEELLKLNQKIKFPLNLRWLEVSEMSLEDGLLACLSCRTAATVAIDLRRKQNATEEFLQKWAEDLCVSANIETRRVCSEITQIMAPILIFILDENPNLTPYDTCAIVFQGEECGTPRDAMYKFDTQIAAGGPEIKDHKDASPDSKEYFKVVHFTDIHYDPAYIAGTKADCDEPICCHVDNNEGLVMPQSKAGFWGDYRNCDIPWKTAEAALKNIAQDHPDADFVYWTGDIIDHTVWGTSIERVTKDLEDIFNLYRILFNYTQIYPVFGNHEAHPVNLFAPADLKNEFSSEWLYDLAVKEWSDWLPQDALANVKNGGYYTVQVVPGFRLIVLNNIDSYTDNFWMLYETEFIKRQLQWFHDTLLKAEEAKEKVHVLLHIPPTRSDSFTGWTKEYRKIIDRFHHIITGQFCGHTHKNEFNIFYDEANAQYATSVVFNGGSITPYSNVNPNYIVYYVDKTTFEVIDSDFYYFDLDEANQVSAPPRFKKLHSFREKWNLPDMSPKSFNSLVERWAKDVNGELREYWELKGKLGRPHVKGNCKDGCLINHLCRIVQASIDDSRRCKTLGAL